MKHTYVHTACVSVYNRNIYMNEYMNERDSFIHICSFLNKYIFEGVVLIHLFVLYIYKQICMNESRSSLNLKIAFSILGACAHMCTRACAHMGTGGFDLRYQSPYIHTHTYTCAHLCAHIWVQEDPIFDIRSLCTYDIYMQIDVDRVYVGVCNGDFIFDIRSLCAYVSVQIQLSF